jgi:hypothetical protein
MNQVKKIVEGSFQSFQLMYSPLLQEYIAEGLLKTSSHGQYKTFRQVYYLLLILSLFKEIKYGSAFYHSLWTIQQRDLCTLLS